MTYYHVRYNIYPPPGFPIEKEEWLTLSKRYDEQEMKRLLATRHQTNITLITSTPISKLEYELNL
jgi:hypothetical protein